ncbi:hypothetical protein [Pseudomonas tohonis]|uniref:hypothetical protein n=1 Tax=Pseudomonas tohonis TaxID=2725477 RepID=UPI001F3717D0|nr:hypothetical protein [Pseudomonas tohonis]
MGVVIGRACLPDLGCNLAASQPERVLGIGLHKHVDLFRADYYRAFADASPTVVVASTQKDALEPGPFPDELFWSDIRRMKVLVQRTLPAPGVRGHA